MGFREEQIEVGVVQRSRRGDEIDGMCGYRNLFGGAYGEVCVRREGGAPVQHGLGRFDSDAVIGEALKCFRRYAGAAADIQSAAKLFAPLEVRLSKFDD